MGLKKHFVELTARHLISCKKCHVTADITVGGSPMKLTCPCCHQTLGSWETIPEIVADLTAFVEAAEKSPSPTVQQLCGM